ncbi:MAG: hypothetical protein MZU97_22970 [Bacillus subtilis]|nr:hypothetical protein [Bacillus subtilis]
MTLFIWIYGLIRKNSSVYDPYWSVVPPVILIGFAIDAQVDLDYVDDIADFWHFVLGDPIDLQLVHRMD